MLENARLSTLLSRYARFSFGWEVGRVATVEVVHADDDIVARGLKRGGLGKRYSDDIIPKTVCR